MEKISGTVQALEVIDVSKRAGTTNLRTQLSLTVERTDPPALKAKLGQVARFNGAGDHAELRLAVGDRVTIVSHIDDRGANPTSNFPIYQIERQP